MTVCVGPNTNCVLGIFIASSTIFPQDVSLLKPSSVVLCKSPCLSLECLMQNVDV